jgi:hypothetical protein
MKIYQIEDFGKFEPINNAFYLTDLHNLSIDVEHNIMWGNLEFDKDLIDKIIDKRCSWAYAKFLQFKFITEELKFNGYITELSPEDAFILACLNMDFSNSIWICHRKEDYFEEPRFYIAELSKENFDFVIKQTPKNKARLATFFEKLLYWEKFPDLQKSKILKSKSLINIMQSYLDDEKGFQKEFGGGYDK